MLKSLHDELDAAVLEAYGWADLKLPADSDTLLERLVTLNAKRAVEEANGVVRWLRPEIQQGHGAQAGIGADEETEEGEVPATTPPAKTMPTRPWPAGLTEQIKAVAEVMTHVGRSLDLDELAAHFSARGRWRERLPTILDTLVTLGRLRVVPEGRWVDAGR